MAMVKFVNKSYKGKEDMSRLLDYISRYADYVSGFGISPDNVERVLYEFECVKKYWNKQEEGRRQVRHLVVSFKNSSLSFDSVCEIAWKIGYLYGNKYQVFYGVHTDTDHFHIHFAINTVSFVDGTMFSEGYGDLINLKRNVSIIENSYTHI